MLQGDARDFLTVVICLKISKQRSLTFLPLPIKRDKRRKEKQQLMFLLQETDMVTVE